MINDQHCKSVTCFLLIAVSILFHSGDVAAQTVTKQLYLSNPGQGMDRIHPGLVVPIDNTTATNTSIGQIPTFFDDGVSIWHQNNVQTPQYKVFDGFTNTYGSEFTSPTVLSNKASVMMTAQSPTDANEAFLLEITLFVSTALMGQEMGGHQN